MKGLKLFTAVILIAVLVVSVAPVSFADTVDVYFSVKLDSEEVKEGTLTANVTAVSFEDKDEAVKIYAVHYSKDNEIKNKSVLSETVPANDRADYEIELDIVNAEEGDKVKLFAWKDGCDIMPLTGAYEISSNNEIITDDFEAYQRGEKLTNNPLGGIDGGWRVTTVAEANTKAYSPNLGSELYASVEKGTEGNALYLYDNADRTQNDNGTGAVMAYRSLPKTDKSYEISFTLGFDTSVGSLTYGGVTLSKGLANTTNNKSNPCAFQLRFQSKNDREKMQIMIYDSVLFNENSWENFFDGAPLFDASQPMDVNIKVNTEHKAVTVSVTDGNISASKSQYFSMMDNEHITNHSWMNSYIDTIAFNTGIGTTGVLTVDNFAVKASQMVLGGDTGVTLLRDNFDNEASIGKKLATEEAVDGWYIRPIIEKNQSAYVSGLGEMLYAHIVKENTDSQNGELVVYDKVGRNTEEINGAGGALVYKSFEAPKNDYSIKFTLLAPNSLGSQQYAGISLGSGANEGGEDISNPLALQMVFMPKSDNTMMQFDRYDSIYYKDGGTSTFLASDEKMKQNVPWYFDITVMPEIKKIEVSVTDGENKASATASYSSVSKDGAEEDWTQKAIDTIIFNTSAGNNGLFMLDDFRVLDLEKNTKNIMPAKNAVFRLEPVNDGRVNYYMYHCKNDGSDTERVRIASGSNHYRYDDSRFIERPGLADSDGVSFESLTYPGYFVKRGDSDKNIYLVQYKDTASYRAKCTWYKIPGLDDESRVSYRSYENANQYLIYNPSIELSGAPAMRYSTLHSDDDINHATWKFRSEATPTMADNFNGTGLSGNWGKNYKWGKHHNHYGLANTRMIEVVDGKLKLHAEKIPADEWPEDTKGRTGIECNIGPDSASKGWKKWQGYMGAIYSHKVYNPPVSMSGRFKTPATRGWWDAFWLNGNNSWPPEIDIFEYRSQRLRYSMYLNVHQSSSKSSATTVSMGDLWGATHTYSLDWTSTYINYYIDGKLKKTVTNTDMLDKQRNMYVIINHGIGGWEYVPDDSTDWSQTFDCEYFKSYQY